MSDALSSLQIGLLASQHGTSGSDRYYFSLVRALRELDLRVRGVVLGDPAHAGEPAGEIVSFAPEGSRTARRWIGLRRAVAPLVRDADLVVSHFAPHAFPVLDRIRARPLVVHFHGPWTLEGRWAGLGRRTLLVRWLEERAVYARARRFIVLSRAFGDILVREYGVREDAIRVIPGGVDLRRFEHGLSRREARERLGWPQDRPIVVTARRLAPTKGLDVLIDAAGRLRRKIPEILMAIVGDGPLRADLQRQVHGSGLDRSVRFEGFVSDERLALAYRAADLSVVPSVAYEGFGLSVVESLACGTPALVTPIAGLPEVVRDLEPALVIGDADATAMARALEDALVARLPIPDERACVRYAERFAWPNVAARVCAVYREAV